MPQTDILSLCREAAQRTGLSAEHLLLVYLDQHYAAIWRNVRAHSSGRPAEPIDGAIVESTNLLIALKTLQMENRSLGAAVNESGPKLVWDSEEEEDEPSA